MLSLLQVPLALEPTKISIKQCQGSLDDWKIDAPATCKPNKPGPTFDFVASSPSLLPAAQSSPVMRITGSLGLPNHPLGIFHINDTVTACGEQTAYIYKGLLGKIDWQFPPCPWQGDAGSFEIKAHVDVYTVIPAFPPLISTGFTVNLEMLNKPGGDELMCAKLQLVQPPNTGADPAQDTCETGLTEASPYPPPASMQIPALTVSLDEPPHTRWDAIVKPRAAGIKKLIDGFIQGFLRLDPDSQIVKRMLQLLTAVSLPELKRMPADFVAEMKGIARVTGLPLGAIWLYNMMYEIIGLCTSVVGQDADGAVWHGRNLDFGLFMGVNETTHNWILVPALQDVLVNVAFTRGGSVVYNSTTYAGFVGVTSGFKGGAFSLTVDTRFDASIDRGVIGWLLGKHNDGAFLTFQTRQALEQLDTYADAFKLLTTYKPLGPAYIILGGVAAGEGAIIAKTYNSSAERRNITWNPNADVWTLQEALSAKSFFVLETNYDRTGIPPAYDDRRFPAQDCLNKLGPEKLGAESLWHVMTSNPTQNSETTFTQIMSAGKSHFEAYKTGCSPPGPHCSPF